MDDSCQHENLRHKMEYYRGSHAPERMWNMSLQYPVKESNAAVMNKKIKSIVAEMECAIQERNAALAEKNEALAARDEALRQRDEAIAQRDNALMERDNALASLHIRDGGMNFHLGDGQCGSKRMHHPASHPGSMGEVPYSSSKDMPIADAFPVTVITSEAVKSHQAKWTKENKAMSSKLGYKPSKGKKVGEDLNRKASSGMKIKTEWDRQNVGLNLIAFDESTMPAPVCTCTGTPRQCYKWGNGGWQSSCCTTTLSMYPLPQLPNKRHARIGGRKMSGSVFTRLLSRLAAEGHDLAIPLDLKEYWARHGTNRYITIK